MVKVPVDTVFATEEPEMVPKKPLASTATLAGPPTKRPAAARARSMKNLPRPVLCRNAPNRMNRKTKEAETPSGMPNRPSVVRYIWATIRFIEKPGWPIMPGIRLPNLA